MKKLLRRLGGSGLLLINLVGCGGTDTGNALQSEIVVGSSSEAAPATTQASSLKELAADLELGTAASSVQFDSLDSLDSLAVAQPLTQITLTKAQFHIRQIAAPPESTCGQTLPARSLWTIAKTDFLVDWLGVAEGSADFSANAAFTTCQVRMIAAPSKDLSVPSIAIEGSTTSGTSFTLTSNLPHPFVIRMPTPQTLTTGDGSDFEIVFYLKDAFTGAQIDALGTTAIAITPATHPLLFAGFLKNLRKSLRAHPFKRVNGQIVQHRDQTLGVGDETEDTLKDGELGDD